MKLRILLSCLCLFILAPATARAINSPEVTYPTGTRLGLESAVRGVNVGEIKFTGSGNTLTCSSASLKGKLKKNTGTEVEADIESASFNAGGECSGSPSSSVSAAPSTNGVPWCLRSTPELLDDEVQIRGGKCGETIRPIRLSMPITIPTYSYECVYERSAALTGTYKTHPEDAVLSTGSLSYTKTSGSFLCPTSVGIQTKFTFEKDESGTNPLYFSKGPVVAFPTGKLLAVNSKIRAKTVEPIKVTFPGEEVTCPSGAMAGTLRKNNEVEVEADIESASFTGSGPLETCENIKWGNLKWTLQPATNGVPWCLRATSKMAADEFQIRGNSCAGESRPIRVVYEPLASTTTECLYERSAAIVGTIATHPESAAVKLTSSSFLEAEPKKAACPDETQLDGSIALERDTEGTQPLYIS